MAEQNLHVDNQAPTPGITEVFLEGGPDSIPRRQVVTKEQANEGKIKISHLSGYEHFVRNTTDDAVNLFSWTTRTAIAE